MTTCDTANIFDMVMLLCGCALALGFTGGFLMLGYQVLTGK